MSNVEQGQILRFYKQAYDEHNKKFVSIKDVNKVLK